MWCVTVLLCWDAECGRLDSGMLGCDVLVYWCVGMLVCWDVECGRLDSSMLGYDVLLYWCVGMLLVLAIAVFGY